MRTSQDGVVVGGEQDTEAKEQLASLRRSLEAAVMLQVRVLLDLVTAIVLVLVPIILMVQNNRKMIITCAGTFNSTSPK